MAKMDDEEKELLIIGGGIAVLYFGVLRPILRNLGVNDGSQDVIDSINQTAPEDNPFSYQFQPFVDAYQQYYDSKAGGNVAAYWQQYKELLIEQFWGLDGWSFPAMSTTDQWYPGVIAESLYNTISFWKEPDSAVITSLFNTLNTQVQVAAIDAYFQFNYQVDLITFLLGGKRYFLFLQWGLTTSDIATIINHVKSLPVY